MAATLLSQHSSNPLEVGSSDVRNREYRQALQQSRRRGHFSSSLSPLSSSDDPINGLEMKEYHSHLATVVPALSAQKQEEPSYIDVDDANMVSDDELIILPSKPEPPAPAPVFATPTRIQEVEMNENEQVDLDDDNDDDESSPIDPDDVDEENTIALKSREERYEIAEEIADLEQKMPKLAKEYKILDRLGTGTFSSVYKAIDLEYHTKWDNDPWHGHHPSSSSAYFQSEHRPQGSKVFVAIKRIYVTSSPERVRNEISIMEDCRGCRHVCQLITAFRENDQVVAIMPYQRNDDFRDYYRDLPMQCIKAYFRCMFRALRDVHLRGIIHRDVKPANFLFDARTGIGTLCDFGLASRMDVKSPSHGACFHTGPSSDYPHGQVQRDVPGSIIRRAQQQAKEKSKLSSEKVGYPAQDTRPVSKANRAGTRGFRAPEVLLKCMQQTGAIDVWSAGVILLVFLTGKFPIFQSNDDTEALMEIATIIGYTRMADVATLHSRTFCTNVPSVQKPTPWREFIEKLNPSIYEPPEPNLEYYPYNQPAYHEHMAREFEQSRHSVPPSSSTVSSPTSLYFPRSSSPAMLDAEPTVEDLLRPPSEEKHRKEIELAIDLVEMLMNPFSTRRITPREALAHPFLLGEEGDFDEAVDDDEFAPHLFGEGVCGHLHFRDETGAPAVKVQIRCECDDTACEEVIEEVILVEPGQGLAIGRQPYIASFPSTPTMALNWTMLTVNRSPVPLPHEMTITTIPNGVDLSLTIPDSAPVGNDTAGGSGGSKLLKSLGKAWLTDKRLIFTSDSPNASFDSISVPLHSILSTRFEQPTFGSNFLTFEIKPSPEGGLNIGTRAELRFKDRAMFEFVSLLEKTRERAIYMDRRSAEEEDGL
ncbi:hypothetical protein H0H93_016951, partial [Arthromyces matolae]